MDRVISHLSKQQQNTQDKIVALKAKFANILSQLRQNWMLRCEKLTAENQSLKRVIQSNEEVIKSLENYVSNLEERISALRAEDRKKSLQVIDANRKLAMIRRVLMMDRENPIA